MLYDILNKLPKNNTIINNFIKAFWIINNNAYKKIICTVSGGSDSDVMMDICVRCDVDNKIDYVWFDTGLEYQATKDHLKYLEEKDCVILHDKYGEMEPMKFVPEEKQE